MNLPMVLHVDGAEVIHAKIRGAHILVAEDNLFNQQVVTGFLENVGASVCIARNGQEVIDLLKNNKFDCVLMDVQMPVMNGFEATRLIRAKPELAGLPVIAMTASTSDEMRDRCIAAGMTDFVGKPFVPDHLYSVISRCRTDQINDQSQPTPAVSATAEITLITDPEFMDSSRLYEMCGGNKAMMCEFSLKFAASVRQDMVEVEAALQRMDLAALSAMGHYISGAARMVGATGLVVLCQALEICSEDEGSLELAQDIAGLMSEMLDQIDEYIESTNT